MNPETTSEGRMDVAIVVMPYAAVEHPAIGPGLLKARLAEESISCEVVYANLLFAEDVGIRTYFAMSNCLTTTLIGEWSFGQAAFPDFHPDHKAYLDAIQYPIPANKLMELRERAAAFVDRLAEEVLAKKPRVVGCSSVFQQNCASLALLRRIKERAPEVATVMGGANCEGDLGLAMVRLFPFVDYAVSGEADHSFPELCRQLLGRDGSTVDPARLPEGVYGASSRDAANPSPKQRGVVAELDALPTPDYDDYFRTLSGCRIRHAFRTGLLFESSRGCWWGQKRPCTFCGLNGEGIGYRRKSAARVADELLELGRRHGLWKFEAVDNVVDMRLIEELRPRLADFPQAPTLMFETRANLTRAQVKGLRDAGIFWIQPGIENLHEGTLRLLNKGVHPWQSLALLKWAGEYGIHVLWNYLCVVPGDDDGGYAEVAQWIPWVMHLQPPSSPRGTPVMYDRFSGYYRNREAFGLEFRPLSFYEFIYPLAPAEMETLAYSFQIVDLAHYQKARPGLVELIEQLTQWRSGYHVAEVVDGVRRPGAPLYALTATAMPGGGIEVVDTRPCAVDARREWLGLDAAVLEACDAAQPFDALLAAVAPADDDALRESIARLVAARILLPLDNRYLALPIRTPIHPPRPPEENPGGYLTFGLDVPCKPKQESVLEAYGCPRG
jgi:ribosomal peptide maturation radical SAM protein 1